MPVGLFSAGMAQ